MAFADHDGAVACSFGLEFDGIVIKGITEVSGLKFEQDVIELKQNTDKGVYVVKKLPGRPKLSEVTVSRPLTADPAFQNWVKDAQSGKMTSSRKGGSIIIYDYEGVEISRYNLVNAWPKALELSAFKAGDTAAQTEKLTLVHEGLSK